MKAILSPRLTAIAEWVPLGAVLADVGTDHAYLPAHLLQQGRISRAIAVDLRVQPVRRARETARRCGVSDRLEVRLCDGLSGISPEECNVIVIAGMGGETISGILSRALWAREKQLILEPQSTQDRLRLFLQKNGFTIQSERAVSEGGRWYPVLLVTGGLMPELSPGELLAGRRETWIAEPVRADYLLWLLRRAERQLTGLDSAQADVDPSRRTELTESISFLRTELSILFKEKTSKFARIP